jgi:hypothetical protein
MPELYFLLVDTVLLTMKIQQFHFKSIAVKFLLLFVFYFIASDEKIRSTSFRVDDEV